MILHRLEPKNIWNVGPWRWSLLTFLNCLADMPLQSLSSWFLSLDGSNTIFQDRLSQHLNQQLKGKVCPLPSSHIHHIDLISSICLCYVRLCFVFMIQGKIDYGNVYLGVPFSNPPVSCIRMAYPPWNLSVNYWWHWSLNFLMSLVDHWKFPWQGVRNVPASPWEHGRTSIPSTEHQFRRWLDELRYSLHLPIQGQW